MADLVEFLRARLDEDSRIAIEAAASNPGSAADSWSAERIDARDELDGIVRKRWVILPERVKGIALAECPAEIMPKVVTHIARYDPARVLAEVDAKRQIVEWHERTDRRGHPAPHPPYRPHGPGVCTYECVTCAEPYPCKTLRLLAVPYAGHADYDPQWRPT